MKLDIQRGEIESFDADAVIVNLYEGVTEPTGATGAVDEALGGAIRELIESGDLRGKSGEVTVLYSRGALPARRVIVVGLGQPDAFDAEAARRASAAAMKRARELGCRHLATVTHGAGIGGLAPAQGAQATVEGALLALYRFDTYKSKRDERDVEALTVVEFDEDKLPEIERGAHDGEAVANGVRLARDLVNLPPNDATPDGVAARTREFAAEYGLKIDVFDRAWAREHEMGAFLAVAQGAGHEPRFLVLEHNPAESDDRPVVLVGKGVTFDTGGISIKPSAGMENMKSDMAGAAAVLGAMRAIAELGVQRRVVALVPLTENMPDAHAYRPADVLRASNGKTIEVISTDAEGRLILADALVYAQRYEPETVIDVATLTGACVVALGRAAAGLFSNDDALRDALCAAGDRAFERAWPLPLFPEYRREIDSKVADMKNSGGRTGGVATSAVFLQEFTDYPWAHLDIAGVALAERAGAYTPAGGSGFGVRLLVEYLRG